MGVLNIGPMLHFKGVLRLALTSPSVRSPTIHSLQHVLASVVSLETAGHTREWVPTEIWLSAETIVIGVLIRIGLLPVVITCSCDLSGSHTASRGGKHGAASGGRQTTGIGIRAISARWFLV